MEFVGDGREAGDGPTDIEAGPASHRSPRAPALRRSAAPEPGDPGPPLRFLVVLAEEDPVAAGLSGGWGTPPAELRADGVPIRTLPGGIGLLRRPGRPVAGAGWTESLPEVLRAPPVPLLFPSVHRSAEGVRSFTAHPLGRWGLPDGGPASPPELVPTAPRLMAAMLRALAERAAPTGLPVTFEATHHGPWLRHPAFFLEIGGGAGPERPTPAELSILAGAIAAAAEDPHDRIAVGVGGGHYVPHFTELALRRRWAFGHLLPRHVAEHLTRGMARAAWANTPGAEGILCARAADRSDPAWAGIGPMLKDGEAPRRPGTPGG